MTKSIPPGAFAALGPQLYRASALTRGPWHPEHQHAGPPIALVCRAFEAAAAEHGLTHISRLTANLLRPVPIGDVVIEVATDYAGRNAGHYSAQLLAGSKCVARFTALAQREVETAMPAALPRDPPGHAPPKRPPAPDESPEGAFPFAGAHVGYADLVETRVASGKMFNGPCAVWFRLRHPLLECETPSVYQRIAVAADSSNGISAVLDFKKYVFVNSDLTINLLRRPRGPWVCVDARTHLGPDGCGLTASNLFDTEGLIGMATQSLSIRARE
ncbi:MAG: thioesterase family protein [Burkholderiaceae bacterium]